MNEYQGFLFDQRPGSSFRLFLFVAKAKDVVRWAHADSIKLDKGNVQRELIESRWRQIEKFFAADPNNVIPTSVTIAFDESIPKLEPAKIAAGEVGYAVQPMPGGLLTKVSFPDKVHDGAFIIDGQHRLKGMSALDFDISIPICLLVGLTKLERAFQFVTINNKSHKVPTDNLKALLANFEQIEADLKTRLTQSSITVSRFATAVDILNENPKSPFYKMVDWVNNRFPDGKRLIQPTALENSLRYIVRAFPETSEEESDSQLVFTAIWDAIFAEVGLRRENAETFPNLILKATIQSLSEIIVDRLKLDFDPVFSNADITANKGAAPRNAAQQLAKGIPGEFWKDAWKLKSLDTAAGRDIIKGDIQSLRRAIVAAKGKQVDWKAACQLYRDTEPAED